MTESLHESTEQLVPERFEKIAEKYPDRLAVKAGDRSLTYTELNRLANRIARAILATRGPKSEPIALLFDHGVDVIAAIFGTLKAGKFYVALDPSFPAEKIGAILEDSQARLIVSNDRNLHLAQQFKKNGRKVLSVSETDDSDSDNPGISVRPDDPVNIRYTSGSTGEPKGVPQRHQQTLYQAKLGAAERRIGINDRMTLLHFVGFGSATTHLFQSLLNGSSLFPFDIKAEGIERLASWLRDEQITVCNLPPSLFRQLAALLQDQISSLRLMTLVGAPITRVDFDLYKKQFGPWTLLEVTLGLTEAGMIASAIVDQNFSFPKEGSPAGYPCQGKKIFLLDENGHEVGPGEIGEIAVKSRYLPDGYWHKPDVTSAKFFPGSEVRDERIYLTGDLGRQLPDGFLVHLGRKDFQVKIRGYRVEPGEIETALLEHAAIQEAIVVARDDLHQEKQLVGYIVSSQKPAPTAHELRIFLQRKLPEYMVPLVYVTLDALPLTLNGKVDRQALPAPDKMERDESGTSATPLDSTEQVLANIWSEILGLDQVSIEDNFFDLGGNSLLAMRLFAEIEKEFKKRVPLSCLEDATIRQLARIISQPNQASLWSSLVVIQSHGTKRSFFCVHELFGDVLCYRLLAHYLGQDQPFYGLQPQGLDQAQKPSFDIKAMAAHYLEEIRTVQSRGPYALGGYSSGGVVAFEMAQQLHEQGETVTMVALFDSIAVTAGQTEIARLWTFLRNLPADLAAWFIGLLQLTPRQRLDLIRFKIRMIKNRVIGFFRAPGSARQSLPAQLISEMGDLLPFSEKQREIALAQCRALTEYEAAAYPGRLTLFRAKPLPLFFSHGSDNGWRRLAAGGVEIRTVPGHHLTMLKEPHVRVLARELRACLDKTQ